jgi:hypothetical protein
LRRVGRLPRRHHDAEGSAGRRSDAAHAAFDPLWQQWREAYPDYVRAPSHVRSAARGRAYAWLADQLGIAKADCHIGHFDVAQCQRVVDVVQQHQPTPSAIRAWAKAQQGKAA